MKITKYGHSCLYVELPDQAVLFDPGVFSTVPVEAISRLNHIFITHEHADHCDVEVLLALMHKFPNATITTTESVSHDLQKHKVAATHTPPAGSDLFTSPHERIEPFGGGLPQQIGVHYQGLLSHPGDSHSFGETMPVLALPIMGPWGSTVRAIEVALELQPKIVIPVHDWFLKPEAVVWMYARLKDVFAARNIQFVGLSLNDSVELEESELFGSTDRIVID